MILRRPYAFLIKHFKAIHAILLLGALFLVIKTFPIISFLGTYIHDGVTDAEALKAASNYTSFFVIFVSFLMVVLNGLIIYLLRYKNKSVKLYIFTIIYYVLLTGLIMWLSTFISNLGYSSSGIRFISILRDIIRATIITNVVIMVLYLIRAIGLDLKKFDFKKDLLDLGIEEEDNEEYEFELKIDKDKIKSSINKGYRYTKYFYKENKYIFITIGCVLLFFVFSVLIKFIMGYERVYRENQSFTINSMRMKVLDSYKTNTNNFGVQLNSKFFYVIVKMEFENKKDYETTINTGNIQLSYGNYELISPIKSENSKFTEFGTNYFSQIIKPNESSIFNLIFEVPIEFYHDSFTLKCLYNVTYKDNELKFKYKKVRLSPETFKQEQELIRTKSLGEKLSFEGSLLGNTTIKINSISINDKFDYNVVKCNTSGCINRKKSIMIPTTDNFDLTLLRINYDINYDYSTLGQRYYNNLFFTKFGSIRFEVNGKEYNNRLELIDYTPYYTGNYAFVQIRDKLRKADKIYLDFNIRDKKYTYIIFDKTKEESKEEG